MSSTGTSTTRERSVTDRKRRADAGSCVELRRRQRLQPRHLLQRGKQPLHAHRLHQVVDRVHLERLQRVLVVRGREDHDRRLRQLQQVARELDAVHVRHVDVGAARGRRSRACRRSSASRPLAASPTTASGSAPRNRRGARAGAGAPAPRRRRSARAAARQPWAIPAAAGTAARRGTRRSACRRALRRSPARRLDVAPALRRRSRCDRASRMWTS